MSQETLLWEIALVFSLLITSKTLPFCTLWLGCVFGLNTHQEVNLVPGYEIWQPRWDLPPKPFEIPQLPPGGQRQVTRPTGLCCWETWGKGIKRILIGSGCVGSYNWMGSLAALDIVIRVPLQRGQWKLPHKSPFWLSPYFKGGGKEGLEVCAVIWSGLDGKPGGSSLCPWVLEAHQGCWSWIPHPGGLKEINLWFWRW